MAHAGSIASKEEHHGPECIVVFFKFCFIIMERERESTVSQLRPDVMSIPPQLWHASFISIKSLSVYRYRIFKRSICSPQPAT